MAIEAVIFDMGGVILRTMDGGPRERLAESLGITRQDLEMQVFASPSAIRAEVGEITEAEHWRNIFKTLGVVDGQQEGFKQQYWAGDAMDEDLLAFIRALKPDYKTGLLSNAWSEARSAVESRFGPLDMFDVVVFSAEVGMRKPGAEIFTFILDQLRVRPQETLFVDDFAANIQAAKALGLQCVHFQQPEQAREEIGKILFSMS